MSGFERFDPRAWAGEGGVTRHVVAKAQSAATSVRRAGTKFLSQAIIAVTVSVAGGAVCAAEASAQTPAHQEIIAEAQPVNVVPDRRFFVPASISDTRITSERSLITPVNVGRRVQDTRSAFLPDRAVLSSGTQQTFGAARDRFLSGLPVQMSDRTQLFAEKVLAQRDAGNAETGIEWAARLMKNMHS